MKVVAKNLIVAYLSLLAFLSFGDCLAAGAISVPQHVLWAEDVALHVAPENNDYGSNPSYVRWAGVGGATLYANRSQCSSFVTRVLKQAYGWTDTDFKRWFGSTSPSAAGYYQAIADDNRFSRITNIDDIKAGDLIAVKYPEGSSTTGHLMIARGGATARVATPPEIPGTYQYEIEVIDSSKTGHGANDTRNQEDGGWDSGAGIGVLRLYADNTGLIQGYTWSTSSASVYYDETTRPLVLGRLR